MRSAILASLWALLIQTAMLQHIPRAVAVHTMIPSTSFNSQADFDTDWNYLYPWGTDHNGGARMDKAHVRLEGGTLTLTAERVSGQEPASHGGTMIDIHYLSGAIHAKEIFNISPGGGYDFAGEFKATTARGTWPAAWFSAISWPPGLFSKLATVASALADRVC